MFQAHMYTLCINSASMLSLWHLNVAAMQVIWWENGDKCHLPLTIRVLKLDIWKPPMGSRGATFLL